MIMHNESVNGYRIEVNSYFLWSAWHVAIWPSDILNHAFASGFMILPRFGSTIKLS